ncbi:MULTISPECIES: winged helix-turn-helix domain-containing protein [Burkholderiaceae]|uniref:winged helix-turn-helix domain-containing protein n=1 Tax=Burkholderiaceae TaxID=119060 RepID=UPI00096A18A4|nr:MULTISPECIES: winged helix-turn-helix domain-containing protein [Burkholderiaceae]MCG1039493.1 winged helix-turn-helix domain-containing protein [Mycetohabitans sp. B7]SIT65061.1 DNA-binding winged helix-turn-helix (wHTH) domain-containing protein [Burkholderia sp. b14]
MSTQPAMVAIAFGRYQLILDPAQLNVDGKPVTIGSRSLTILRILLEANGRTVSTGELREKVWHNADISVNSIQSKVAALRRALGGDEHLVATVRGQGYRFTGEQRSVTLAPEAPSGDGAVTAMGSASTAQAPPHPRVESAQAEPFSEEAAGAPQTRTTLMLPHGTTPFVGRHAEISELLAVVPTARVVALTGPAGIGKTRVALELVRRLGALYPHGTALVHCAPQQHVDAFARVCIRASHIEAYRGDAPGPYLREWLKPRRMMLLIHDVDGLPVETTRYVNRLIDEAPEACVIVTATDAPGIHAEHVVRISPLQTPSPSCGASSLIPQCDALQLLFARLHILTSPRGATQQRRPPTAAGSMWYADASPEAIAMAARVAALAEGMPLALELAAFVLAQRIRVGEPLETALATLADTMRPAAGNINTGHASMAAPGAAAFLPLIRQCMAQLGPLEHVILRSLATFEHAVTYDEVLYRLRGIPQLASMPDNAVLDASLSRLIDSRLIRDIGIAGQAMLKVNEWLAANADAPFWRIDENTTGNPWHTSFDAPSER